MQLRPYQQAAVDAVYNHLRDRDDNPCVVIPTAGGKTPCMATICKDAVTLWQGRVLVLAHVKELLQQTADKLTAVCPEVDFGIYSAGLKRRDTNNAVIDPKLQPLALGLGTVPTHALQSNSPAINAGKVLTDARGLPSNNDIGAVELETTISLSTTNASLTEDASGMGSQFTYTITRGGNVADRHEIYFVVNPSPNSRITPSDFGNDAFPMGKVIFEPGATSASFTISVASDTVVEPNEAFTVSILSPSAQVRKLVSNVTSTIVDNDTTSVTTTAVTAVEGESLRYIVTLQGNVQGGFQLPWSLGASGDLATLADNDYIASSGVLNFVGTQGEKQYIEAITRQDQKVERHESLSVTTGTNLGVAPEMVSRLSVPATLVGTIQNDDRTTIYISEVSKTELHSGSTSVYSGFTVWPNPVDTSLPLTLQVTSSNATLGSDYSVSTSTLTLPGTIGTQSNNVVSIIGDNTLETDEVVQIAATLTDRSAWSSFISVVSGKVTIVDDDGPTLAISDVIASESNSAGYIEFQVQLLNNNGNPLTVDLRTKNGTAIAGEDYQQTTRTLSFSGTSGETLTFQVPLLSDGKVELDESLSLEPVDPLALSSAGIRLRSGVGTIKNDDVANIEISPPLRLDDQAWHFEIRLSNPVDVPVTVTMSSTEIMASPTNHFSPSTTTFSLLSTSDVGRLVVNYQPQLDAARNVQVAPVSVSSSGRPVNLPQSQNAAIPVHQANAGVCRPVSGDPLAPPPAMQFSGAVPSGYDFAYEVNNIRVYKKPHGRTVAYYETDKISQFTFYHDGHLIDETGVVWDKVESHTEGYFLLKWFVYTVQMTPPATGQPNPPGCGTPATPPANSNEEDEELLTKEIADPGKTADWVIPYTSPGFTFRPFSSDAMSDIANPTLVVTLYDGAVNPNNTGELKLSSVVYKPGDDVPFPNGKLHINQDRTLTFTPNGQTGTLVPELNPAGHPYRLIDLNYFEVHLIDKSQLTNAQTSSITPYQSMPASVAVANHLPILMGETTHAPEDGFYLDSPVFLDFLDDQEVDLRTLYTDPDGETDIDKLWIKSIYYSNNGNTTSDGEGTLRVQKPIGALVQYSEWFHLELGRTEKYLIVEAQENKENKPHKIMLTSEVSRQDAQSSNFDNTRYPVSLEFQVELTDGSKITLEDGTEKEYTWFTTIRVRPNVYTSEAMWKQKTGKPDVVLSNWVSKLQPGIREFDPDAAINYTDINFTAEARNATTNSGIVDVNGVPTRLFDGSFMYGADIPLDAAGGTSELGLSGLIYDSSQVFVSTADAGSEINKKLPVIQGRVKIPLDRPLPTSATVNLTWENRNGQTSVPVSKTFKFGEQLPAPQQDVQHPASHDMVFAIQGDFVPQFTGVYRWKMELVLSFDKPQNAGTESFTKEILGESIIVVGDQYNLFGNGWNLAGIPILWVDDRKDFQYETGDSEDDRVVILFPGEAPRLFNAHELIKNNSNFTGELPSLRVGSNAIGSSGYRDSREFGNLRADGTNHYLIYKDQDGTEYFFKEQSYLQQKLYLIERIEQPGLDKANLPNNRKPLEFVWQKINNKPVLTTIKATDGSETTISNLTQAEKVVSTTLETKNSANQIVHRTILEYDTRGNLSKIRYADLSSNSTSPSYHERRFQYDGDVLSKDEWLDGTNVIRTSSFGFDFFGALKSVTRGHNNDPTSVRLEIESALSYGLAYPQPREEMKATVNLNQKASVKTADSVTEASLGITHFYFNLNGTVRKEVTGLIHNSVFIPETTKSISYSPLNDVKAIEEEGGRGTYYWYDYEKQPKVFDANSTTPVSSALRGNVVRIIAPTGNFTYTYETDLTKQEQVGKLLRSVHKQLVDASGGFAIEGKQAPVETKYKYNEKGRLTKPL